MALAWVSGNMFIHSRDVPLEGSPQPVIELRRRSLPRISSVADLMVPTDYLGYTPTTATAAGRWPVIVWRSKGTTPPSRLAHDHVGARNNWGWVAVEESSVDHSSCLTNNPGCSLEYHKPAVYLTIEASLKCTASEAETFVTTSERKVFFHVVAAFVRLRHIQIIYEVYKGVI